MVALIFAYLLDCLNDFVDLLVVVDDPFLEVTCPLDLNLVGGGPCSRMLKEILKRMFYILI